MIRFCASLIPLPPLCSRGMVNFAEVISETRRIGYDGLYNFEIPGERKEHLAVRGYQLDDIRNLFAYLWETCE